MKKTTLFLLLALGAAAVFFLLPKLLRRDESTSASMAIAGGWSGGCIKVNPNQTRWEENNWWDAAGEKYLDQKFGPLYTQFDLNRAQDARSYAYGYLKQIGLKPTVPNIKSHEKNILAYLKGNEKFPHWDVPIVGNMRCGGMV